MSSGSRGEWHCDTLLRKSQVNRWWKEVTKKPLKSGLFQHYLLSPNFFYSIQYHACFSCTFSLTKSPNPLFNSPSPQATAFRQCLTQPPSSPHHCQLRCRSRPSLPAGLAAGLCRDSCCLSPLPWANEESCDLGRRMLPSWGALCAKVCLRVAAQVLW